jgi:glycosyltransferase involved in cell wall biosynthesis
LVVTINDLASFRFPETLTAWTRRYERTMLPRTAAAADLIIAPSNDTADDLQSILGVPATKIRVVPHGVGDNFFSASSVPLPSGNPYVLFVGTPQPRKNLPRLVAAMDRLWKRGSEVALLLAGSDGWGNVDISHPRITKLGRISDAELRALYHGAACLALVSLHEGFGLPALEAMAMGTPVVASDAAALPELVGDAAVLVDPLSAASIADGIVEAMSRADELREKGRARAREYSWEKAAERTAAVYGELL